MSVQIIHSLDGSRGDAPAFWVPTDGSLAGRLVVASWETMDPIPDFQGVAFDFQTSKFVLTELDAVSGERTINYLRARNYRSALMEADFLKIQLESSRRKFAMESPAQPLPIAA